MKAARKADPAPLASARSMAGATFIVSGSNHSAEDNVPAVKAAATMSNLMPHYSEAR